MRTTTRNQALIALAAAGLLWGTSVPLTKAALTGLGPAWLTVFRFAVAGLILVAVLRPRLRDVRPALVFAGALGYGACIVVQNIGLTRTSVTHAALLIGAVPMLVAVMAVIFDRARVRAMAWAGFGLSLAGIAMVAGSGGGDASLIGDALVFASVVVGSGFTIVQARMLPGQDVIAVSAAQFLASAAIVVPVALVAEGIPAPGPTGWSTPALLAAIALATVGTVVPYTLFALGQTGVAPQVAGVFLNLETLVAAFLGATVFGEAIGVGQAIGALALVVGIYVSTANGIEPAARPESTVELESVPAIAGSRFEADLESEATSILAAMRQVGVASGFGAEPFSEAA
ncbi:MAG TPA: DMT family transporter [Kineosporiaceae bacterium]|nr:DMT family transporter [Kineosporiaceae bacterium]